jgi:F-type H+-transporting ATPase subunit a
MRYIFSFFTTIFLLVLLSNWLELVPGVDSIGFLEPHAHVDETSGEVVYLPGYETVNSGGIFVLNPKCPWVSPVEAATLSAEAQASRATAGCLTGTGAPVEEVHEGEATAVAAETVPSGAEGAIQETGDLGAAEGGAHEIHAEAGSASVPWVVLPFLRAPSTDLNMTASLALIAVVMVQVLGFRALGIGYLTKFFNFKTLLTSPLGAIDLAVGLLELIGEFAKILSFSFRLLGNIFAGSILLFVMSFLVPFLPWPFFILEFGVGIIQAIVFGLLTAIFMSQATAGHGGEHHEEAAEAH